MLDLSKVTSLANRGGLLLKKHEPEILVGLGIVGFGASVVTACHATLKIDDILAEHNETMEKIDSVAGNEEFAEKYFRQGLRVAISGRITTGSYTNKDGIKVYTTEVTVEDQEFAESKAESEANKTSVQQATQTNTTTGGEFMNIPDDIPEELPFN